MPQDDGNSRNVRNDSATVESAAPWSCAVPLWSLQALCGRPEQSRIGTPFAATIDGSAWTCATNGHGLALVRGAADGLRNDGPPVFQVLRAPDAKPTHSLDFPAFVHWLSAESLESQCERCGGNGISDYEACDDCDGEGSSWAASYFNLAADVWIDRVLAARYLTPFAAFAGPVELHIGAALEPGTLVPRERAHG